jgi:hypothetical protein
MTSSAIHIPNMLEAISTGVLPGALTEDRLAFEFPTLAYLGARGATHLWTISVRLLDRKTGEYAPIDDEMLDQPAADLAGYKAEITVEAQQVGGKIRDIVPTYVSQGKNAGKKNATNALTQALRDALGLYNKHRKRADIVEAADLPQEGDEGDEGEEGEGEGAGAGKGKAAEAAETAEVDVEVAADFDSRPPPMLVKVLGASREATLTPSDFVDGVTVQRKLNGVRYVVFARTGAGSRKTLVRYSRTGSDYPGQKQIVAEALPMFERAPRIRPGEYGTPPAAATERDRRILEAYGAAEDKPGDPGVYLDGELFLKGKSLNWISGQARRGDDEGLLQYHVFDVFFPYAKAAGHDMESRHRQAYLQAFFAAADAAGLQHPHVVAVENFRAAALPEVEALAKQFVRDDYEGAIARKDKAGYRYAYSGYHSANLVKIKPVHDAEFPVVGFTQGTRGKDVGAVLWECEVPKPVNPRDKTFTVTPKDMTYEDRYAIFSCLSAKVPGPGGKLVTRFERDIKGLPLTVEYAELSAKTGKPLQAKAVAFRTYEGGPENDPVKRLLDECLPKKVRGRAKK